MKNRQTHFPDLTKQPLEKYIDGGGTRHFKFKSFCGFSNRDATNDIRQVTCLLCLRSIIAQIRRAAVAFGSDNPTLINPNLFEEIRRERKPKNKSAK